MKLAFTNLDRIYVVFILFNNNNNNNNNNDKIADQIYAHLDQEKL